MKINHPVAIPAASLVAIFIASSSIQAGSLTSPSVPVGWLSANPGIVRAGAKPELKWNITYPATVIDYVTVSDASTVTPKQQLEMEIRILGAGVTASSSNSSRITFVPTEAKLSYDGASYQRLFYGSNPEVDPTKVVFRSTVRAGAPIRFGGRYYYSGNWGQFHFSASGTRNVRTLVNGQVPPTTYPLHTAPTLENFIKPYLDASGKVMIGPMDVIVFMELTHTDSQADQQGYDLQDMVLLVTFKTKS
jgi:hypothetical protein